MTTISPSNPCWRSVAAAVPPPWPAPTTTIRPGPLAAGIALSSGLREPDRQRLEPAHEVRNLQPRLAGELHRPQPRDQLVEQRSHLDLRDVLPEAHVRPKAE